MSTSEQGGLAGIGPVPGLDRGGFPSLRGGLGGPTLTQAFAAVRDRARSWWGGRGPGQRKGIALAAALFLVGGGIGAYFALRPVPQPDYLEGNLDDIFSYTLLTDEFNKLPVEERLKLMGQLVDRLRKMSGQDSMLLGAFAAGIAGSARDQIERNMSRLAIDVWDRYAVEYRNVPEGERAAFLESTFVNFEKMMETLGGEPSDRSDEERLERAKRNAERDRERLSDPNRQPGGAELGRFFAFMDGNVGGHASPQQRVRGQQMMRDMVRHFRGQDVSTGKPAGPG